MVEEKAIKILLVDDHMMVRQGLVYFLSALPMMEIVGQAETGKQAVELAEKLQPQVILMDLILPELDGLEATRIIKSRYPEIEVIALTSYVDDDKVMAAIQAGVSGYVMKDVNPGDLARAIQAAARGELYLHPEAARRLARGLATPVNAQNIDSLTEREVEVLRQVSRGLSNQDIADNLRISVKTVKTHVSSILQKLNLQSRVQAVLYALRNNIIPLDDI